MIMKSIKILILLPFICSLIFGGIRILLIGDSVSKLGPAPYIKSFSTTHPDWTIIASDTNDQSGQKIIDGWSTRVGCYEYDWVIINFGIHDIRTFPVTDSIYRLNCHQIADSFKLHNKKVIFCLTTPLNDAVLGAGNNARVISLNSIAHEVFDSVMGVGNIYYVNSYDFQKSDSAFIPWDADGIHFTGQYAKFANNIFTTMEQYIPFEAAAQSYEYSSYGISSHDSTSDSLTMSEYSSYGINGMTFFYSVTSDKSTAACGDTVSLSGWGFVGTSARIGDTALTVIPVSYTQVKAVVAGLSDTLWVKNSDNDSAKVGWFGITSNVKRRRLFSIISNRIGIFNW